MARPVHADAELTRAHVLRAAIDAFGRHGRDGTTVRDIGAAAGVTFATVHHYFGSKDDLYAACLDHAYAEVAELALALAADLASAPPREALALAVRRALEASRHDVARSRFLLRAFVFDDDPATKKRVARAERELLAAADAVFERDARFGARLPLVALVVLVTRFTVTGLRERELFAAETGDAGAALEAYLCEVAEHTLRLRRAS